jgi:hypothetical protein
MTIPLPNLFGIDIPSDSPLFLTVLGFHVLAALIAVVTGVIAMLSVKRAGRHPRFGTLYYWCLSFVFLTATILAAMRWSEDAYLFFLGAASFSAATLGRAARRRGWQEWVVVRRVWRINSPGLLLISPMPSLYGDASVGVTWQPRRKSKHVSNSKGRQLRLSILMSLASRSCRSVYRIPPSSTRNGSPGI